MNKSSGVLKVIGCSFGASIAASLSVLLLGACVFGFRFAEWAEWQGGFVGVAGTVAGVAGAVVGLKMALRALQRGVDEK